ncbi:murein transglycosylase A [Aureimonas sp. AU20]|uniref:murein transglycosylase A n=2 Tax=Aureimonas sp. AU20 TaxID=1349819 RepID=UPI0007863AE1|nr:MltA domain-containing protein [Aureimonas sp. AU20]
MSLDMSVTAPSPPWRPLSFSALAEWPVVDPTPAFLAFARSAPALVKPDAASAAAPLRPAAEAALRAPAKDGAEARRFFERFFRPWRREGAQTGFLTGYYEPELPASRTRSAAFSAPLYRAPADLLRLSPDAPLPDGLKEAQGFARVDTDTGRLSPYPDRAAIEAGFLEGRGLELVFLADPVEAFFVHVQGSARLRLPDGETMRVGYAAKNGHRFTAIGRVLVNEGELPLEGADMAGIRRWLAAHPERAAGLMRRNRSFIFFREIEGAEAEAGPIGAQGVALTPLASLAVDAVLTPYGTPILVDAPTLPVEGAPFHRLVVAQDTGSAITGPERGDLFTGSGEAAGALAGTIRHPARWTVLRPAGEEAGR